MALIALIANTQIIAPTIKEPESPIKSLAGEKLNTKNPSNAPQSTKARSANGTLPKYKNINPKKPATINPIPPARPSIPSIKLKAFTITTYTNNDNK